jgi:hypothetical protein
VDFNRRIVDIDNAANIRVWDFIFRYAKRLGRSLTLSKKGDAEKAFDYPRDGEV